MCWPQYEKRPRKTSVNFLLYVFFMFSRVYSKVFFCLWFYADFPKVFACGFWGVHKTPYTFVIG